MVVFFPRAPSPVSKRTCKPPEGVTAEAHAPPIRHAPTQSPPPPHTTRPLPSATSPLTRTSRVPPGTCSRTRARRPSGEAPRQAPKKVATLRSAVVGVTWRPSRGHGDLDWVGLGGPARIESESKLTSESRRSRLAPQTPGLNFARRQRAGPGALRAARPNSLRDAGVFQRSALAGARVAPFDLPGRPRK